MKKIFTLLLLLFSGIALFSQWECRSKLGAHLKPIGESNLMWAAELIGSAGYLSNSTIANGMGFLGLDYSNGKSTLYFEGGFKYWNKNDHDMNLEFDHSRWGLRELFYRYRGKNGKLSVGLHSSKLGDQFLLNERLLGFSYQCSKNNWNLNISTGTVSNDFARNGTFCSTCYLYDFIPGRPYNNIGMTVGETNMAGLTLGFTPGKKKEKQPSSNTDDEFASMSEFDTPGLIQINEVGIALYSEFGDEVNTSFFTGGLYSNIVLPLEISFKPEVLFQTANNNNGLIFILSLNKDFLWGNGHKTSLLTSYYDFYKFDNEAIIQNRFTNILAGEVLRLDATESPIFLFSAKHTLPHIKTHFKCLYAFSNYDSSMQEFDIQIGKTFFKHLQSNAIFGYIDSDLIRDNDHAILGRLELRFTF